MAHHPNGSFRRGAFAATAIASMAVTSLFPSQSLAQTMPMPAAYQGTAACAKFARNDPTLRRAVQCEARELDRRIAAEKKRGADADRRRADALRGGKEADQQRDEAIRSGAEADHVKKCADFLMSGLKQRQFTKEAVLAKAEGKVTAVNACIVARSFGHGQKAELPHPSVN